MVTICSHRLPLRSQILCNGLIFIRNFIQTKHIRHTRITCYTDNRLDGKIGIMSEMTGEIIRTQLIFRIKTKFTKIVCPHRHHFPMFLGILRTVLISTHCCCSYQHVSCFLNRHIIRIGLTICQRVGSHIMSWERFIPSTTFAIMENMIHQCSCKFCIILEENRERRICNIYSSYRSVAVILL